MTTMTPAWQVVADDMVSLFPMSPEEQGFAVAGVKHLYNAIDAATTPEARRDAVLQGLADNVQALANGIKTLNMPVGEALHGAKLMLDHLLRHFDTLAESVEHGHS